MLKELIHEKVNEIFLAYQEANNVTSGDIYPLDAFTLEQIEDSLEALIRKVVAYQPKAIPSSYLYRDSEGIIMSVFYPHIDTDKFFCEISRRIAFDDCSNEEILNIIWQGKEVEYVGWQPCMKYEYRDLDGNTVWVGEFPEWDH
jgi:hypothetical protein